MSGKLQREKAGNDYPQRGHIYWVKLDPSVGTETKKTRPGLIVSNNTGNKVSSRVIAAPITSASKRVYPFEVEIETDGQKSKVMLDQIRVLDKKRLGRKIGMLSEEKMKEVNKALKLVLSLG